MGNGSKSQDVSGKGADTNPSSAGRDGDECGYEVGYGKPPIGRQFARGHSGNPKGRPRGDQNFRTLYELELSERVAVKEQGKRRKMTRRRVIVKRSVSEAMAGSSKHLAIVIAQEALQAQVLHEVSDALTRPADNLVKEAFIRRLRALAAALPSDSSPDDDSSS